MDAWRYGIYLLMFTFDISLVRYRCEHSKINSISPRAHVLFSIFTTEIAPRIPFLTSEELMAVQERKTIQCKTNILLHVIFDACNIPIKLCWLLEDEVSVIRLWVVKNKTLEAVCCPLTFACDVAMVFHYFPEIFSHEWLTTEKTSTSTCRYWSTASTCLTGPQSLPCATARPPPAPPLTSPCLRPLPSPATSPHIWWIALFGIVFPIPSNKPCALGPGTHLW